MCTFAAFSVKRAKPTPTVAWAVSQGVVDVNIFPQTAENAARLNLEGMKDVDHTIIDIITHR